MTPNYFWFFCLLISLPFISALIAGMVWILQKIISHQVIYIWPLLLLHISISVVVLICAMSVLVFDNPVGDDDA